jgi:hypothetical protein
MEDARRFRIEDGRTGELVGQGSVHADGSVSLGLEGPLQALLYDSIQQAATVLRDRVDRPLRFVLVDVEFYARTGAHVLRRYCLDQDRMPDGPWGVSRLLRERNGVTEWERLPPEQIVPEIRAAARREFPWLPVGPLSLPEPGAGRS